jgi:hypothetical protein
MQIDNARSNQYHEKLLMLEFISERSSFVVSAQGGEFKMFTFFAGRLLLLTLIVAGLFLAGCAKTSNSNAGFGQFNPPAPKSIADGKQTTGEPYEGFLDAADCNTIWGWAWNKNQKKPNDVVFVEILQDGVPIATIPASQARWSVAQITGDDGYHGFVYTVPPTLKDGKPHAIRARISQTDSELQNGPRTITCPPQ